MASRSTEACSYVEALADFAAAVYAGDVALSAAVQARAKQIALDSVGVMVAGRTLPEVAALRDELAGEAGLLATVLLNGTAGVSLELDEGCAASRGHPGIHLLPTALEVAAREGVNGTALLRAIIAGYEIAARLGGATVLRPDVHPHGTWGACGAAVAAGLMMGLAPARLATAIRIAATLSIATHYSTVYAGATARNLWSGMGNLAGLLAVNAARAGYTGANGAPEHVYGEAQGTSFDPAVATAGLGEAWYITRNYFKQYACCRHAHSAVDAFRSLVDPRGLKAKDIDSIEVSTYRRAVEAIGQTRRPQSSLSAKFSLPYIFGVYLETGGLGREAFEPPHLGDPASYVFADRVEVREEAAYTAMLPDQRVARVRLHTAGGAMLEAEAKGSRGDPDDPLSEDELLEKFYQLTTPVLGRSGAEILASQIRRLESLDTVVTIVRPLGLVPEAA